MQVARRPLSESRPSVSPVFSSPSLYLLAGTTFVLSSHYPSKALSFEPLDTRQRRRHGQPTLHYPYPTSPLRREPGISDRQVKMKFFANTILLAAMVSAAALPAPASEADIDKLRSQGLSEVSSPPEQRHHPPHTTPSRNASPSFRTTQAETIASTRPSTTSPPASRTRTPRPRCSAAPSTPTVRWRRASSRRR